MDDIYVIMKSTGEYSDRYERPIAYVLTEAEAIAAIERVTIEAQRGDELPEYPETERTHDWFMPDGRVAAKVDYIGIRREEGAKFGPYPDADARKARNEALMQKYYDALEALGHVDPEGADKDAQYSYECVSLVRPA